MPRKLRNELPPHARGHRGEIAHFDDAGARERPPEPFGERLLDGPRQVLLEKERAGFGRGVAGGRLPAAEAVAHAEQVRQEVRHARAVGAAEAHGDEVLELRARRVHGVHGLEPCRRGAHRRRAGRGRDVERQSHGLHAAGC
jgi:hypothetical protein